MAKKERVSTGVKGLDKQMNGGIPKGSIILVSGAPGTGKTILGMQFLDKGIKDGKKCVYVIIEEPPEKIISQAEQFGLFKNQPVMISAKDIKYDISISKKPESIMEKTKLVLEKLKKIKPDLVVIDSLSSLSIEDGIEGRKVIRKLFEGLNQLGITAITTSELAQGGPYLSRDTISEFLADGVLLMNYLGVGDKNFRSVKIVKLRETGHEEGDISFEIKKKGIAVKQKDKFKI